ncbi:MAG: hypothetical protein MZV70_51330 [Desulfobacterales bacterium]|nr:hypothetical protein [Desulfobacterales bacterium]
MKKTTKRPEKTVSSGRTPCATPCSRRSNEPGESRLPIQLVTFPVLKAPARFGRGPLFLPGHCAPRKIVSFFMRASRSDLYYNTAMKIPFAERLATKRVSFRTALSTLLMVMLFGTVALLGRTFLLQPQA